MKRCFLGAQCCAKHRQLGLKLSSGTQTDTLPGFVYIYCTSLAPRPGKRSCRENELVASFFDHEIPRSIFRSYNLQKFHGKYWVFVSNWCGWLCWDTKCVVDNARPATFCILCAGWYHRESFKAICRQNEWASNRQATVTLSKWGWITTLKKFPRKYSGFPFNPRCFWCTE